MSAAQPVRLEVASRGGFPDGRARRLLPLLKRALSPSITGVSIIDVYIVSGMPGFGMETAREVFADEVSQVVSIVSTASTEDPDSREAVRRAWDHLVEVTVKPGVTDPVAYTALQALRLILPGELPPEAGVQTGTQYLICAQPGTQLSAADLASYFANPLIQSVFCISRAAWEKGERPPPTYPAVARGRPAAVECIDLAGLGDGELAALSRRRLLALSLAEMKAVQQYFRRDDLRSLRRSRGLPEAATDVELEMIAQTWSEHCKHKIFNAVIRYRGDGREEVIRSLFHTFIKSTTETVAKKRRFLRSVFHDNAGVISFDRSTLLCFKVETHNSPSALDPYGGAITGIVGVNRDILGTGQGALPFFNTDVLCFADPRTAPAAVPPGLMHPRRVMEGVHRGIVDGGNQSGIPVVAGAFLFDESFLGKPLVFCGTGGILPARVGREKRRGWEKSVRPGDRAVMAGGRVGKDGIHGATFSSEALSESSPTSAVQIGDPITQKRMADMILEARDLGLYRGITDNGAGGLSSSLGEMASLSGGVRIDLDACPLKYQGLAPWEILVSESQERMSLAVPPQNVEAFIALAARRGVEAAVVGEFTDSGFVEVIAGQKLVGLIELPFLHEGLPVMELHAEWQPPVVEASELPPIHDLPRHLRDVLADLNIASKEFLVRQYDHEVQGRSVIKPFAGRGRDAPSDGGVLRVRPGSRRGVTVTHGICPWYGDQDAYDMAQCAVDEAVRAHVALGGDPEWMSALDNFCWPDPVESPETPDGRRKLAQLVRACRGLADACRAFQLPLISGKDSMKNDARVGGRKISIRPTLLVSLMGIIRDVRRAVTTDFKQPGDLICLIGETRGELGGTRFEKACGRSLGRSPSVRPAEAWAAYRRLHRAARRGILRSCHDLSDGGLWAALAESCIGGGCGARVTLEKIPVSDGCGREPARLLFCETPSRLLATVRPGDWKRLGRIMRGSACAVIGEVMEGGTITVSGRGGEIASIPLEDVRAAWKGSAEAWA